MKIIKYLFVLTTLFACSGKKTNEKPETNSPQVVAPAESDARIIGEQSEPDTLKGSLKAKAMGTIGDAGITINYFSPAVRGRVVWGGLVPFANVWVTGAHRATNIEFNGDVVIGSVKIAAGKYALFTIPGKEEWTVILNNNWNQHLADDYSQKDDIVRIKVKAEPEKINQERLRYSIDSETDSKGKIVIQWEKLKISVPLNQ